MNEKDCLIWCGATTASNNATYGQKRLTVPHLDIKSKVFYIHRLAYMLKFNNFDLPHGVRSAGTRPLEVSHLCHDSLCANPDHLVLEPHEANAERISCRLMQHCVGTHKPACIV